MRPILILIFLCSLDCRAYYVAPVKRLSTSSPSRLFAQKDPYKFDVNSRLRTTLTKIPKSILVPTAFLATSIFLFEVSKVVVVAAIPVIFVLGTTFASIFLGGIFSLATLGLLLLSAPVFFSLFAAISFSSIATLSLSFIVTSLAVQVLMMDKRDSAQRVDPIVTPTALDDVEDTLAYEVKQLWEFDQKLRDIKEG